MCSCYYFRLKIAQQLLHAYLTKDGTYRLNKNMCVFLAQKNLNSIENEIMTNNKL